MKGGGGLYNVSDMDRNSSGFTICRGLDSRMCLIWRGIAQDVPYVGGWTVQCACLIWRGIVQGLPYERGGGLYNVSDMDRNSSGFTISEEVVDCTMCLIWRGIAQGLPYERGWWTLQCV